MDWLKLHGHRLLVCVIILLATAGCFQAVGSDAPSTDVAQVAPTFTPIPSDTPIPTEPPPTEPPQPTAESTLEEDSTGGGAADAMALLTPSDLLAGATVEGISVEVAQAPTLDPLLQTVTAIYAQDNQAPVGVATEPAPIQQPIQEELDPIAMTATFIVERATQTAAFPLTEMFLTQNPFISTPTLPATAGAPTIPGATPIPGTDCVHEVRATDRNLYRISLNYGLTVQQIATASGIANPDLIFVGQMLTIPGCGTTGAVPLPTSTATAGAVVNAPLPNTGNTGATAIPAMTFTPLPNGQALPPASAGGTHTVMQGETLFEISLQYGTTVHAIASANGISNINVIYIGQELVIP